MTTLEARRKPNSGYAEVMIAGKLSCVADVYAHEPGSLEWARLFAAAPDLLAACEAQAAFEDELRETAQIDLLDPIHMARLERMRDRALSLRSAAIAKAKGES